MHYYNNTIGVIMVSALDNGAVNNVTNEDINNNNICPFDKF